jgi:hypothetical protein
MIKLHCFQKEWIDGFRSQELYSKINPPLLEKMIHALSLLQYLQTQGLNFILKGGTSLILLLKNSNRFSVDIDIITEDRREEIEKTLDKVVAASHFKKWKLDEKRSYKEGVPKAHYEFEYDSNVNKSSNYILLDILFEKAHYPEIQLQPIESFWIETEKIIEINIPGIEAITGDKLTAFAPATTGILYGKGKELEIIKQLFDLGNLFNQIKSLEQVALSFTAFAEQEITYRKLDIQPIDILKDSINTCRIISFRERNRNEPEKSRFAELQSGIRSFGNYLISGNFRIDEAVTASAKVAYLCAKLLIKDFSPVERYDNQDIKELEITNQQWNGLNRLKRFPDQSAFFYWYKCLEMLKEIDNT